MREETARILERCRRTLAEMSLPNETRARLLTLSAQATEHVRLGDDREAYHLALAIQRLCDSIASEDNQPPEPQKDTAP